jgi:hypothetical protein
VSQNLRLRRDVLWPCQTELRSGAIGKPVVHAVDLISDIEFMSALPKGRDDTRELVPWHGARASPSLFCVGGGIPEQFGRRDTTGSHANQQLAVSGLRLRKKSRDKTATLFCVVDSHYSHKSPHYNYDAFEEW